MISTKTVLILGAGASKPYGFPLATELQDEILSHTISMSKKDCQELEIDVNKLSEISEVIRNARKPSFDALLESYPDFIKTGKKLISSTLLALEDIKNNLNQSKQDDWYIYLINEMTNNKIENFTRNNIDIITFNYDRSLEQCLYTYLKNGFNIKYEEAAELINGLNIIHCYGQLGYLPWQDKSIETVVDYKKDASPKRVINASEHIDIIQDDAKNNKQFLQARKLIEAAHRVIFLGFGFHETNLKRLGFNEKKYSALMGTAFKVDPIPKNKFIEFCNLLHGEDFYDCDIMTLFRNHVTLSR